MSPLGACERMLISCLLWLTVAPRPLRSEFNVAYVSDQNLHVYICTCERELPHCSKPDASACDCKDYPLSRLQRAEGSGLVQHKRITVWYSSPPHVALLLHNAEVRHLTLVKCCSLLTPPAGDMGVTGAAASTGPAASITVASVKLPSREQFVVQRLENLNVSTCHPGSVQDLLLGWEMGAEHHEEARIAVFNTAALVGDGEPQLKAYTVRTNLDAQGLLPFPNLQVLPRKGLPDSSSIFVTFLY